MRALLLAAFAALSAAAAVPFEVEKLVSRDEIIWGFDFLPDGKIILTERSGTLVLYDPATKKSVEIPGGPAVYAEGQGGLLDARVHPNYAQNGWVYLTYSLAVKGGATTALGRGVLKNGRLNEFKLLFAAKETKKTDLHFGSRIEFLDGYLFMTVGERNSRHDAQKLGLHMGKVLRLTEDGKPAAGNPFEKTPGALPEIWSYGHRNPQGLARRPGTKELWSAEFGPRGGDELNKVAPAANYGWPVVTYGKEYWGPSIGEGTEKSGMTPPVEFWVPSISPSALAFYDGKAFPAWKGNAFLACLSATHLRRLVLSTPGESAPIVTAQEKLLGDRDWRFRAVRQGPDGYLYFSTDEGLLARLVPARP